MRIFCVGFLFAAYFYAPSVHAFSENCEVLNYQIENLTPLQIRKKLVQVEAAYEHAQSRSPAPVECLIGRAILWERLENNRKAHVYWEDAQKLEPESARVWLGLAGTFDFNDPKMRDLAAYEKAFQIDPTDLSVCLNFAAAIRRDWRRADAFFKVDRQKIYDRVEGLYREAKLSRPFDLELAKEAAQFYYEVKPVRIEAALAAWTDVQKLIQDRLTARVGVPLDSNDRETLELDEQRTTLRKTSLLLMVDRTHDAETLLSQVKDERLLGLHSRIEKELEFRRKALAQALVPASKSSVTALNTSGQ